MNIRVEKLPFVRRKNEGNNESGLPKGKELDELLDKAMKNKGLTPKESRTLFDWEVPKEIDFRGFDVWIV